MKPVIALAAFVALTTPALAESYYPISFLPPLAAPMTMAPLPVMAPPSSAFAYGTTPQVVARVSLSQQRMDLMVVSGSGPAVSYSWAVSTGRSGYETPTGAFQPTWLDIDHRSKQYDDTPMPYSVFFTGGYAVHATDAVTRLGAPASHGCVRLAPQNAAAFYQLVATYGRANTQIVITN